MLFNDAKYYADHFSLEQYMDFRFRSQERCPQPETRAHYRCFLICPRNFMKRRNLEPWAGLKLLNKHCKPEVAQYQGHALGHRGMSIF